MHIILFFHVWYIYHNDYQTIIMKYCYYCGYQFSKNEERFCSNCGKKRAEKKEEEEEKAEINKGITLAILGKYNEAIECFDKALEIKPDYFEARYLKGKALADLGKYDKAIECYDKALEIKPDYFEAWNDKGVTLVNLGRFDEAIECYNE